MDGDSRSYWIITGLMVIMAAVFALIETALSSVSKTRIKVLADRGDQRARSALFAVEHFDHFGQFRRLLVAPVRQEVHWPQAHG